jgi:hypothetical protein
MEIYEKNCELKKLKERMAELEAERMAVALEYENARDEMDKRMTMMKAMKEDMANLEAERMAVAFEYENLKD